MFEIESHIVYFYSFANIEKNDVSRIEGSNLIGSFITIKKSELFCFYKPSFGDYLIDSYNRENFNNNHRCKCATVYTTKIASIEFLLFKISWPDRSLLYSIVAIHLSFVATILDHSTIVCKFLVPMQIFLVLVDQQDFVLY